MSLSQQDPLTQYVSNLDKNVYAIYNLPEEVIAVIFAYVSRSPKGFRENLRDLLTKDRLLTGGGNQLLLSETAQRFHERWVVGYGHSSVAEHAVAHVGVEKISRLASAELELANPFNSFTEYSQRYQRPQRGGYYVPPALHDHPKALALYHQLQEKAFSFYEELLASLLAHLQRSVARKDGESEKAYHARLEKLAFEDARYALTLATHTSLGMTGNGRSLRDTLVVLLSSPYPECTQLARQLEEEISRVLPTLLRHVRPSPYLVQARQALQEAVSSTPLFQGEAQPRLDSSPPEVKLEPLWDYETTLRHLAQALVAGCSPLTGELTQAAIAQLTLTQLEELALKALEGMGPFDNPLPAFEQLVYRMEFRVSEANWHQLLRHNRKTHFVPSPPGFSLGFTIPPRVAEAGMAEEMTRFLSFVRETGEAIAAACPEAGPYCVTNAHRRRILASATLWELYRLINLRTSPEAQWDIRSTFEQVYQQLLHHHPVLARFAKRRHT